MLFQKYLSYITKYDCSQQVLEILQGGDGKGI